MQLKAFVLFLFYRFEFDHYFLIACGMGHCLDQRFYDDVVGL